MELNIENYTKYIVLSNHTPVGVISFHDEGEGHYYLGCLCVIPTYQGMGIGTQAFQYMLSACPDWKKITLVTPADKEQNVKFYTEKCGFSIGEKVMEGKVEVVNFYMNRRMKIGDYSKHITAETLMGPNSVRVLEELFDKYPLQLTPDDLILDLGCGKGLTSLVIAKETGAKVYANDLWVSAEENRKRFDEWGIGGQVKPVCEDANNLHFNEKQFDALFSIDSYHYFAGQKGFFQEKILPFIKDNGVVLIGIPGLKDEYTGHSEKFLSDWLGDDTYMFKSPIHWKELIGSHERIESVTTWEMDCFNTAWSEWLAVDNEFARGDKQYFETIIKPYTCFVGIYVKIK